LLDDLIYVISGNNGILTCLNARTGAVNYEQERLEQLARFIENETGIGIRNSPRQAQ
jgi:hypothetical protein